MKGWGTRDAVPVLAQPAYIHCRTDLEGNKLMNSKLKAAIIGSGNIGTDPYLDGALPLSKGQTISQPLMVAMSVEALRLTAEQDAIHHSTHD